MNNVLIKPLVTEKTMKDVSGGKYTFVINKNASKTAVKQVLKDVFQVDVVSIETSFVKGKKIRVGKKRTEISKPVQKFARVKLKKGQKISLFEPGGDEKEKKKKK